MKKSMWLFLLSVLMFGTYGYVQGSPLQSPGNQSNSVKRDAPYYGYYSSSKGIKYKKLKHNLLGFAVDLPANWTFGIVTQKNIPVLMAYPEGLNTSKFSQDFRAIEFGSFVVNGFLATGDAAKAVVAGMKQAHQDLIELRSRKIVIQNDMRGVNVYLNWTSKKSGYKVYENIFLFKFGDEFRSIGIRTTSPNEADSELLGIASSYVAFKAFND